VAHRKCGANRKNLIAASDELLSAQPKIKFKNRTYSYRRPVKKCWAESPLLHSTYRFLCKWTLSAHHAQFPNRPVLIDNRMNDDFAFDV
jgi:hypothetical protein